MARLIALQVRDPSPAEAMARTALLKQEKSGNWEECVEQCDRLLSRLCEVRDKR
jgi:hypothetical protein